VSGASSSLRGAPPRAGAAESSNAASASSAADATRRAIAARAMIRFLPSSPPEFLIEAARCGCLFWTPRGSTCNVPMAQTCDAITFRAGAR
jgi:hypothetical protein